MAINRNETGRRCVFLAILLTIFMGLCVGSVIADADPDEAFKNRIGQFKQDGVIPEADGKFYALGDYDNSLAAMGYTEMTPLLESENFVISVKMSWISAILTPNSATSGCGIYFNAADRSTDHVMVSLRMDGTLNLTGSRYYNPLNYAKYAYTAPSYTGAVELTVIVTGRNTAIYLNGERYLRQGDLPISGNVLGLAVLSGSYQDYGTKCNFEDIHVYTWE